ncbi:calcium-binding protein [Herbaspirillum sp. ST 5-3]|uniref:calcium-binding protein n=1 Tax=Herbaspirillum sp. ST 5-3 TaxID=2567936 RepID=UPI0010A557CB|nr:calcium-binding protein [Herbaspirillum sp. ST 5-3]
MTTTFSTYGIFSEAAYSTNNSASGQIVLGWQPVLIEDFHATNSSFAAQLYTDGNGNYRIAFRGSDNLADFTGADAQFADGNWHAQMADAVNFAGAAILQIKRANQTLSLDEIRASLDVTGHSLGGGLAEVTSKFYGLNGMSIDGPGASGPTQSNDFATLKQYWKSNGLNELQDNYQLSAGAFEARQYTVVGTAGQHLNDVAVYTAPPLQTYLQNVHDTPPALYALDIGGLSAAQSGQGIFTLFSHPMAPIFAQEGVPSLSQIRALEAQNAFRLGEITFMNTHAPDGSVLNEVNTTVYATATAQQIWTRDSTTGHYQRVETVTMTNTAGALTNSLTAITEYDSHGHKLSFKNYLFDANGQLVSSTSDILNNFITSLQTSFHTAKVTVSPLILDLDGNGVETIGKSAGIHFDHDGNHFAETTGWAGKDDGLLVLDRNGNGQIDNGGELFGNNTLLANGSKAANGFAALAELDNNHDGKIDASDAIFSELRVWKDGDGNAQVSNGELLGLEAAGVTSINLTYSAQSQTDAQGNQHLQAGQYTRTDGSVHAVDDVWFDVDLVRTVEEDLVPVSDTIAALPDLQGFGNVHSLHQAMARDTSGQLKILVENFVNADSSTARHAVLDQLLFAWTGSDQYAANSRGDYIDDGRKLYTLEKFLTESFVQGSGTNEGTANPGPSAAAVIMQDYQNLAEFMYGKLLEQTPQIQSLYSKIGLTWNSTTGAFDFDVTAVVSDLQSHYVADPTKGAKLIDDLATTLSSEGSAANQLRHALSQYGNVAGQGFEFYLATMDYEHTSGSASADTLQGLGGYSNSINGLDGNDSISGAEKSDVLDGGSGNDNISGGAGNDLLTGGTGNDTLYGGAGNDTYMFNLGDGADTINDYDTVAVNADKLQFGAGINASDIQLTRSGNDLTLNVNETDKVTLSNYFYSSYGANYRIETIAFADGTTWDVATVAGKGANGTVGADTLYGISGVANRINGLGGNDSLYGQDKDDVLDGGAGNDNVSGGGGNDLLMGGTGNDTIDGGYGNDTYMFNLGDGADTINDYDTVAVNADKLQFGAGINASDIQLTRSGNDLTLNVNETDKVTLSNYFYSSYGANYRIETIAFADGTTWDVATVAGKGANGTVGADTLYGISGVANRINGLGGNDSLYGQDKDDVLDGGAGNDNVSGGGGNDLLTGGTGNDTIDGGAGNDIYMFNLGDGVDTIGDYDTVVGNVDKLQFGAGINASDIQVNRSGNDLILNVNTSDKVTLSGYFYSSANRIETIAFADGTTWDVATVAGKQNGTAGADTISGLGGYSNSINGLEGNDSIYGQEKSDVLSGGAGNDYLNGGAGNDIYMFNLGDGVDTIGDYDTVVGNVDKLQFGAGINASDIQVNRSGNDLILNVNTSDKVTLSGYFYSSANRIETIAFADGTTWDVATVAGKQNGTAGADTISGLGGYSNSINGLEGNDSIYGQDKDDVLDGGAGNDNVSGGGGNDLLTGGTGNDTLSGGAGNDIFKFVTPSEGTDTISDFTSGADVIQVIGGNFGLTPGAAVTLLSGASTPVASGTSAQFLYNTTTGALYFDQDGEGANYGAIQIATLTGQKTLLASDFVVASA